LTDRETPDFEDSELDSDPEPEAGYVEFGYRGSNSDPLFGLLLAAAISIGLTPVVDTDPDLRYTIVWGMLALFGVMAWLFGNAERIGEDDPLNLVWGGVFGLILSIPVLAFVGGSLTDLTNSMFEAMQIGTVLAYLIFVMPLAETLFFRGLLQPPRTFWLTALLCTAWQLVLFFPLINSGPLPLIAGIVFLMANLLYGYVFDRNGLAAAWVCQITVNLTLLFLPFAGL